MKLTQEFLKESFEYKEGLLYWKYRPIHHFNSESNQKKFNSAFAGKEAGYINKRTDSKREGFAYRKVRISFCGESKLLRNHRLVFLYHNGHLPDIVDHINGDYLDDRIENLREANYVTNGSNSKPNYNRRFKGCSVNSKGEYRSSLCHKGRVYYLGTYKSEVHAAHAYNLLGILLSGPYFSGNDVTTSDVKDFVPSKYLLRFLNQGDS